MLEESLRRIDAAGSAPKSRDLSSRAEIHELVVDFYREVIFDEVLGPVFEQVARVDWSVHIPKLTDFWCRVLLSEPVYGGRILGPHVKVHSMEPFRREMFDRWYGLFAETVDSQWAGPVAERAKEHARTIAANLSRRILNERWEPPASKS